MSVSTTQAWTGNLTHRARRTHTYTHIPAQHTTKNYMLNFAEVMKCKFTPEPHGMLIS